MSLDVHLIGASSNSVGSGIFVRENGGTRELTRAEWDERYPGREPVVCQARDGNAPFRLNITHNLGTMAARAGFYAHLWRPEEVGVTHARQLIVPLERGLDRLLAEPDLFRELNPSTGWGRYEDLVHFAWRYLKACRAHPDARVEVSQ